VVNLLPSSSSTKCTIIKTGGSGITRSTMRPGSCWVGTFAAL
jgi:hypothetical protein